jgi:hypothetical protein
MSDNQLRQADGNSALFVPFCLSANATNDPTSILTKLHLSKTLTVSKLTSAKAKEREIIG